jgi:hypothetical protein
MGLDAVYVMWGVLCRAFSENVASEEERVKCFEEWEANWLSSELLLAAPTALSRCRSRCAVYKPSFRMLCRLCDECPRGGDFGSIVTAFVPSCLPVCTGQGTDLGVFCSLSLLFEPEDGGITLLRNFNKHTKLTRCHISKDNNFRVIAVRIWNLTVR